jgi:mannosyl-oligosaccharide alpha-1,2-mannosidase
MMPSTRQSKSPLNLASPKVSRWRILFGRNRIIQALLGGALAFLAGNFTGHLNVETALDFVSPVYKDSYWDSHREEVKDAFVTSWDAYVKYAWGKLIDSLVDTSLFPLGANTHSS